MNATDKIILITSIILILIIVFILITSRPKILPNAVLFASKSTQFGSTYYEVYDKSTDDVCDRLIIVSPFNWYIWAKNGLVYLLNATNQTCPPTYTPSTLVPSVIDPDAEHYSFKSVCLYIIFNDIVESYKTTTLPIKIAFNIKEIQSVPRNFTILDALNDLFKSLITMDNEITNSIESENLLTQKELLKNYSISTIDFHKRQNIKNRLIKFNKKVAK